MKKHAALTLLGLFAILFAACAPRALSLPSIPEPATGAAPADLAAPEYRAAPEEQARSAGAVGAADQERLVVQTASLSMVVTDPLAKATAIRRMAEGMGGYVVSSYIYQSTFGEAGLVADSASITVRVPAERLEDALEEIKADAVEVRSENVTGEDVTAAYVDLESRKRNLEAAEAQLMEIMDTATKTQDVLAVYNELVRVRGEIEMVRGQMQYYEESAAFSSISVELIPDVATQPIETGGWQPQGTVKAAVEALIRSLQWLADAAIWLGICGVPLLIVVGLPLGLVVRAARRRRAKAAAGG